MLRCGSGPESITSMGPSLLTILFSSLESNPIYRYRNGFFMGFDNVPQILFSFSLSGIQQE
jgi:hypothetical protein